MAKQIRRQATKCEENANRAKVQCKTAMEKGNMDGARIFAETAIREKNQAVSYLRLSSRLSAVHQRVENAIRMRNVSKAMSGVVQSMDHILKTSMDVVKLTNVMDQFEQQFEDLDIACKGMETSMGQSMAVSTPETEVEGLMQQVADEHGLEVELQFDGTGTVRKKETAAVAATAAASKTAVTVGADNAGAKDKDNKKPGDDQDGKKGSGSGDEGGSGGGGGGSGGGSGGSNVDADIEARLRRLQGL